MRRRDLITLVAAAVTSLLVTHFAWSAEKVWRIGYLTTIGQSDLSRAFVQGLKELGYVEGEIFIFDLRVGA
jgi:hypothetical protein